MKKLLLLIIMVSLIFTGCKRRGEEEPRTITPKSEVLTEPEKEKMYQAGVKAYNENNYRAARQYFYSIWQNDKSYQSVTDYYFNSSYNLGVSLKDRKKQRDSLEFLKEAHSIAPDNAEAKKALTEVLDYLSKHEKNDSRKLEYLEEAYQINPGADLALQVYALKEKSGKKTDGLELLENYLSQNEFDKKVFLTLVRNLIDQDILKAFEIYQNYQSKFSGSDPEIAALDAELQKKVKNNYQGLARLEANKKNWDGVINYLEKARAAGQENVKVLALLGEAYLNQKNDAKAFEVLQKALELDPQNLETLKLMRRVYQEQNNQEKLFQIQKKIVELMPTDIDEKFNLVELYTRQEKYAEAMDLVTEIIQKNPDYLPAQEKKAYILFQQGNYAEAKKI
ncbi:MAG: tetratricopeptide repeat protein, partial [Candidatus Wallbacteria bacterium]|nr:tetratricopeptide repeat protein [Candidatus Wallbacteria bacterium]